MNPIDEDNFKDALILLPNADGVLVPQRKDEVKQERKFYGGTFTKSVLDECLRNMYKNAAYYSYPPQ